MVPSLVLNAVVTSEDLQFEFAAIPIRRVPVFRDSGRRLLAQGVDDGEKTQERYQNEGHCHPADHAAGCGRN